MAINNPIVTDSTWLQDTALAIQEKDGGSKIEVPDFAGRIRSFPSGGGSEIVSGVVNQNGTITFNDGDGVALFTTSGGNLVTSGAQQISMGYDSGGFYFSFDDGQEAS